MATTGMSEADLDGSFPNQAFSGIPVTGQEGGSSTHSRQDPTVWTVFRKTLGTKQARLPICLLFVCIVGGILAWMIPTNSSDPEVNPLLAFEERYYVFRAVLDKYSEPWTFVLPNSPQRRAFQWLVFEDTTLETSPVDETRLVQRYAIMTLFYACAGPDWMGDFALYPSLDQQMDENECAFPYVTCNGSGVITDFVPRETRLVGRLPDEIALLTHLVHLDLGLNQLDGEIPEALFQKMTNLESLYLDGNRLGSTISPKIESLAKLSELHLSNNRFTGTVPRGLATLDLKYLRLSSNPGLTGEILTFLKSWPNLENLSILDSPFTGTIPPSIVELHNLTHLVIGTDISGELPSRITQLTNLREVFFKGEKIRGTFPSDIEKLSHLERIGIASASISGSIPSTIGELTMLSILVLFETSMTGTLPTEVGLLTSLESISLVGSSGFHGVVPSQLASIPSLAGVHLAGTSFTGTVPAELCERNVLGGPYPCSLQCDCCVVSCNKPL